MTRIVISAASALQALENPGLDRPDVLLPVKALEGLSRVSKVNQEIIDYYSGMIRASPRAWALSLLTMWHETPTRYPPTSRLDYWRYGQYTPDKPLLKEFPGLVRHTRILCDSVLKSAAGAVSLSKPRS